jgi:hypothetical protein
LGRNPRIHFCFAAHASMSRSIGARAGATR